MKYGVCRSRRVGIAGSLRVPLRYDFSPLPGQEGARGMVDRCFSTLPEQTPQDNEMATVGIIANPASGKDIRRLVAHGRFVPNEEKISILKRLLAGLDAVGIDRLMLMPDGDALCRAALDGASPSFDVEFVDMPIFNEERDSTRAARAMADAGADCIVTLGGDGTNRAVAKGSGRVPLVAVSTGTNNVFPTVVEPTSAGLAAGVVARGMIPPARTVQTTRRLEVWMDGELRDIALIDVAISRERFIGSRAIWDMGTIDEIFLSRTEPAATGLSAIGARLLSASEDGAGLRMRLGEGGTTVLAPVAPGKVEPVGIREWAPLPLGEEVEIELVPCTVALDGERSFTVSRDQAPRVKVTPDGPMLVSVEATLREASAAGAFRSG
jgi:hypothetical protein